MFLGYLNFCPDFFNDARAQLDKKAKVNSKIYDLYTLIAQDSRSKVNQTKRIGLLKEYMRKISLAKPCAKCRGEASHIPFYKKSKLSISLDQQGNHEKGLPGSTSSHMANII